MKSQEIQFRLDPPVHANFGGYGECLISQIDFHSLRVVSTYSPPVGGKAILSLPSPGGSTPLAVEISESQAGCPDTEAIRQFSGGMVFFMRCHIHELSDDARNAIIHLLESNFSRLQPAAGG
ncbi:MAG: hypothetical protein RB296_07300 [Acidobacteriota bacterium]|jgi:hypothetical protein|nr:hypothetical protein [Acidobacteriota bacterium]